MCCAAICTPANGAQRRLHERPLTNCKVCRPRTCAPRYNAAVPIDAPLLALVPADAFAALAEGVAAAAGGEGRVAAVLAVAHALQQGGRGQCAASAQKQRPQTRRNSALTRGKRKHCNPQTADMD